MANGTVQPNGTIQIHGRTYKTVALRVQEFREAHPITDGWAITADVVSLDADGVVMRATVSHNGTVVGTGYAEEKRASSQINRTSALENCETSAIGRALAACGFAGSEYASANEVENAIAQQSANAEAVAQMVADAKDAVERGDWLQCCLMDRDSPEWQEAWGKLSTKTRGDFKALQKIRDGYVRQMTDCARLQDASGFAQLNDELDAQQARYLYKLLPEEAQAIMTELRKAA